MIKDIKYVCPDCGGQLITWEEKIYEEIIPLCENGTKEQPRMGVVVGETGCAGIGCTNCGKSTYANGDNGFDNKEVIEEIEAHVWNS